MSGVSDAPTIPEDEMQAILDETELGGTPSEAKAIEDAYALGHARGVRDGQSKDSRMMAMLLALVRKDGRAIVQRRQLDAIAKGGGGRLDSKVLPSGDIVLTYLGPRGT